jgi:4-hydroxy-tetrahydrodipicolinate synthase
MVKVAFIFFVLLQGISIMIYSIENGVYAAALTPLRSDLRCDDNLLTKHCLQLMERGCKGVVLFGTTGEGPSFSVQEKKSTLKQVISNGLDPKKMIVANGASSLQDTVDLGLAALENDCFAYLVAPPCFFTNVTEAGVLSFYREVIQRISDPRLQVILYHIPQYTGVPLSINIVKTLCTEFPNIVVGLKESEGNLSFVKEILETVPHCQVFVGKEEQIPLAVSYGASGTICGIANVWPELICSVYQTGNISGLKQVLSLFKNRSFISSCKALLSDSKNSSWNLVRPPLIPLSPQETNLLKNLKSNLTFN